ncbi:MAG: helix-turn-helix domain-containing protein [Candidatus Cyclobacteriaceae bacterium M3_2C_046]
MLSLIDWQNKEKVASLQLMFIMITAIMTLLIKYAFIQGLLLSFWLMISKRQFVFAAFFLSVSYLLMVYLLEVEGWYRQIPHLLWTNVPFWFLLAPLLFLQTRTTMSVQCGRQWKNLLHFFPAAGAFLYMLPFYTQTAPEKIRIFEGFYSQEKIVDFVQMAYLLQMIMYAFLGKQWLKKIIGRFKNRLSNSDLVNLNLLSTTYYFLGAYIMLAAVLSVVLSFFTVAGLSLYILAFLLLSFTIITATLIFMNAGVNQPAFAEQISQLLDEEDSSISPKYVNSSLSRSNMQNILDQVEIVVKKQQLYKNPELKMAELSAFTQIPSHHISQSLNQLLKKSFFTYINIHRVEAVKEQLQQGQHQSLTLMAIAESCGFRSESSFYRIFKSHTGLTPKAYIRQYT